MKFFILLLAVVLLVRKDSMASASDYKALSGHPQQAAGEQNSKDLAASSPLIGALSRSNRKSRCVRCYDDRYDMYETDRYSGGGYGSRRGYDDDRSYYNGRGGVGGGAADYDRYGGYSGGYGGGSSYGGGGYGGGGYGGGGYGAGSSYYRDRDDRYSPRSYYDEGRRGGYDAGRYSDRGDSRSYYDNRDRYSGGDRYYDRSRQSYGGGGADYDRGSYPRYDYRNYRPFDETYRGQSGFDNSGRGYYFAGDSQNEPPAPQTRCSATVLNCPYGGSSGTRVTSRPLQHSDIPMGNAPAHGYGSGQNGHNNDNSYNNNNNQSSNGWRHIKENEQDEKQSMPRERERERERDVQQSSSYGGRQQRPLGGSYLFDRDSSNVAGGGSSAAGGNSMVESKTSGPNNNNNLVSSQGQMPNAQAQTADGSPQTPKPLGDMAEKTS